MPFVNRAMISTMIPYDLICLFCDSVQLEFTFAGMPHRVCRFVFEVGPSQKQVHWLNKSKQFQRTSVRDLPGPPGQINIQKGKDRPNTLEKRLK